MVEKLKAGGMDRSLIGPLIHDARRDAEHLQSISSTKVGRGQNKAAHEQAHLAIRNKECRVSCSDIPSCIEPLVLMLF
jgi:hypothetical protein